MESTAAPLVRQSGGPFDLLAKRWLQRSLIAFGIVLLLITNLPWHLDDYDQAKQAYTSFEMVKQGHWFYQHTPRGRVATKPPLIGWVSAATFEATRSWTLAWRLPSIAAALALAFLLIRAGGQAGGASGALIAAVAFFFNFLTPRLGSLVRTDMPLALVTFGAGLLVWDHIRSKKAWDLRDRAILFLLLASANFIKGPIIYAFLLPGLLAHEIWRKRTGAASGWSGWWPWIGSLVPLAVWGWIGIHFVPGFYDLVFLREFLGRFSDTVHTPQPFYFYLPHLLQKFAPWSLLLLFFAWLCWRKMPDKPSREAQDGGTVWLVCWIVGGLLVMSVIPSKRVDRIFPLIPPMCLLIAALVGSIARSRHRIADRLTLASVFVAIALTTVYSVTKIAVARREHAGALVAFAQKVRQMSAKNHWHYEAIYGGDEALILYLDRTAFIEPQVAVQLLNESKLNVIVVSETEADNFPALVRWPLETAMHSEKRVDGKSNYVLVAPR